jgi:general secretion pathway protein K
MSLGKNLGLKGGRFEVVILDEESKINLNMGAANEIAHIRLAQQLMAAMGPPVHNPIFEQRDSTGNFHDRLTVCSSLIDWADMDEQRWSCDLATTAPTGQVIEDYSYYSMLPKPYRAKNAPYDSLEELRLVRGISDDFWLTFVNRDPKNPRKRDMTVWGQGAVNVNTASGSTLLALVCSGSGAPESELCTNPTQMATFLAGVTMARGISMGAPLFGNSGDFMTMMKGGGLLGPLLATLGLKPIKFKSESEFTRAISTESKFFSIYAVGVVKGYKRETRIATHTVVDFRTAPVVTATAPVSLGTGVPPAPPAPTATVAQSDVTSIAAALQPSTGGQIVYYRVE